MAEPTAPALTRQEAQETRRALLIAALHIGSAHEGYCRASACEGCTAEADRLIDARVLSGDYVLRVIDGGCASCHDMSHARESCPDQVWWW